MSASSLILDMMRAHYRGDAQAFRTFCLRLARMTKSPLVRASMMDVIEKGGRAVRHFDPNSAPARRDPFAPPKPPEPSSAMLERAPEVTLDELLYEPDLRARLDAIVLEISHRAELAERKLTPRCRLLFAGPPGNGKTSAGSGIANELGVPAYAVTIPALVSKYVGATGENLAELFRCLGDGSVVILDEIDAIGGRRANPDQAASKEQNAIVNSLLTLLDRSRGGTLIATTNRIEILDPALVRRFDDVLVFPAPSELQKTTLAETLAEKHEIASVYVSDCENFDAVTKRVISEARRLVMVEILKAKAETSEDIPDEDEDGDDDSVVH